VPALARVASEGLRRGDALRFRLSDGRGTVSLGGASADVPRALDVARAYLEFDFIGAILARELAAAIGGDGESRPRTARDELVF
jgi:hypothetical protein